MQEEKKRLSGRARFFIVYFAILILVLTVLGIMKRCGLCLIETGTEFFLFGVLVCSALVWLTFFITKRIYTKWAKILAGCVGIAVTFMLALLMIMVFTVMIEISLPSYYNSFTSEKGKTVVVMSEYSTDAVLREARTEGELQGNVEELGLTYTAYPRVMTFFYNSKQPGEGKLEIGYASNAQLMYEWIDGNTFHLFIEGAQAGDEGENTLKIE